MQRLIAAVLAGFTTVIVLASPALALRDPFDPVITSDAGSGSSTVTGSTTTTTEEPNLTTDENPFSDGVPNTGADTSSWLTISYLLVVFGAGAIVIARMHRPLPVRRH